MGQITIDLPTALKKNFRVVSEEATQDVLREVERAVNKANETEENSILGLWADREESVEEIAKRLRSGWTREVDG